ncbi:hypothetical protein [Hymenobacter glacieicola]|uniref:Uncharacterized protein n=1 Tax=Hymenobacter glacieicola TaxID=1562124 RepID=A0ABQ1X636_9BACT|nr:hypothetical protein [Hymenobacter glacieicola]GGG60553.1 hypothetical protein GCM10011378_40720 [Hymenobacter glacieicola]
MTTTATSTGTTLEVAAPCLPYEPRFAYQGEAGEYEILRLALDGQTVDIIKAGTDGDSFEVSLSELTPILRPFEALVKPLADGTVPAVEVAKLLANDWAARYSYQVHEVRRNRVTVRLMQWDAEVGETLVGDISILADWSFFLEDEGEISHLENLLQSYTQLRSLHFAVGLEPHQFIAKQD